MARSQARRQKQLAKKKAKRSAKRHEVLRERSLSAPQRIAAPGGEIITCLLNRRDLLELGIANASCAVRLKTGEIGVVVYLIDRWCLGVKDVVGRIMPAEFYADWVDNLREKTGAKSIAPAALRRLLDDAVAFARSCGQPPHPAYARYQAVLARIDPSQAKERFEMGDNGKPHFFAGPNDDEARCYQIYSRLRDACGEGNFHYTMPIPASLAESLPDDCEVEEFDDEDEYEDDEQNELIEPSAESRPRMWDWWRFAK